ncbi:MAG TPA: T9SS type A sorting domain-containing protein, partial [Chitinophagales bacterium]|nr:T9SS type A sorting domain-containing protein [Chitinophagales bacterium]
GNLTEKLFQLYDFGWETYGRYIYAYDGSGFNISIESQAYDGVEYTSYQKWEFTEYADGLPSMNTISQWDGFIWVDYFRALFYYESYDDGNVDIANNTSQFGLEIYPNPAADVFTISFESAGSELINLQVTNITGQTVLHQTIESAPGLNKIQYPIQTNWAPGVYQVSLTQGGTRVQRSLVVE